MIPERIIEQMHGEIDGTNSDEARAALREFLRSSEEGRRCFEGLLRLAETFRSIERADPPADLRDKILASALAGPLRARARSGRRYEIGRGRSRLRVGLPLAFAGGALAATLLFLVQSGPLGSRPGVSESLLSGTLGVMDRVEGTSARVRFEASGLSGSAGAVVRGGAKAVEIEVRAGEVFDVELAGGESLRFTGVSVEKGRAVEARIAGERAYCTVPEGTCMCVFMFESDGGTGAPILVRMIGASGVAVEKSIRIEEARPGSSRADKAE